MYTFYFKVCPTGLSATTKAKLIAVKGIDTPASPKLGAVYGELTLRALLLEGHKVVVEPAKPSDIPVPEYADSAKVPTMRYAKGYGPVRPAPSAEVKTSGKDVSKNWRQFVEFRKVELTPEAAETAKAIKEMAKDPAFVKSLTDAGYTVNWSNWDSIAEIASEKACKYYDQQNAAKDITPAADYKFKFSITPPPGADEEWFKKNDPKPIHFVDDECRLTRWERFKGWFSRNFWP